MSNQDVSLSRDCHAAAPQTPLGISQALYDYTRVQTVRSLDSLGLSDEVCEAGDEILAAYRHSPELLGKVMAAIIDSWVDFRTCHVLELPVSHLPSADEVAQRVLAEAVATSVMRSNS